MEAGHALQLSRHTAKVEYGFFSDGVFGDDFPIELDRVIYHTGEFAHDNVQVGDAFGICLFCVVEGDFQEGLGDRKFVHLAIPISTLKVIYNVKIISVFWIYVRCKTLLY